MKKRWSGLTLKPRALANRKEKLGIVRKEDERREKRNGKEAPE